MRVQDSVSAETRKGRSPTQPPRRVLGAGLSRSRRAGAIVRRHDRDRYQTALFAPADRREALFALYAFNYEVARVRETVTTADARPDPAAMVARGHRGRLCRRRRRGGTRSCSRWPRRSREFGLSRAHFDRLIDARERDLDDAPPADLAALVDYAEGTSSALVYLALEALGAAEPAAVAAARDVGIAYALAGLLRAMPFHAASGRSYIPDDIAVRVGLDPAAYARRRDTPALRSAAAELAEAAARISRPGGNAAAKSRGGRARRCCRR